MGKPILITNEEYNLLKGSPHFVGQTKPDENGRYEMHWEVDGVRYYTINTIPMSNFHLSIILKHWPIKTDGNNPMVRKFAEIASFASLEEQDIQEFCDQLSDELDNSFRRGQDSVNAF